MNKTQRKMQRLLITLLVAVPLFMVSVYLWNPFGALSYDPRQRIFGHATYLVPSRDMQPTVSPEQIVIVRAGYYRTNEPQRGDILIFINREDGNAWIKRVVGLPGETISIEKAAVLINDRKLVEEYVAAENSETDYSHQMPPMEIRQGQYFLLGDNRDNSVDSRMFGTVGRNELSGKVMWILK
ncbi:MAG: signal peptidase I [Lysobacteraceae bacterium]|nr:MAG: signal peptidase I [Xanthomonadaceae bacterium]